jgi:hypothetical protein
MKSKLIDAEVERMNDTGWVTPAVFYVSVLKELGFERVYTEQIKNTDETDTEDMLCVYAHRDGIVLVFDTCSLRGSHNINSAEYYYNAIQLPDGNKYMVVGSGGLDRDAVEDIWCGSNDGRLLFRSKFKNMYTHVRFLPKWVGHAGLHLLSHADWKGHQFSVSTIYEINLFRAALLPKWVQEMIEPAIIEWKDCIELRKEKF